MPQLSFEPNWWVLTAGFIDLFLLVGHFKVGGALYVSPLLRAKDERKDNLTILVKKFFQIAFHLVGLVLVLTTVALLVFGWGLLSRDSGYSLITFIGILFGLWGLVWFGYAGTTLVHNAIWKLPQWIFFFGIAVFVFLGLR